MRRLTLSNLGLSVGLDRFFEALILVETRRLHCSSNGYYFEPSGKPGLGDEYDKKFVVSRRRLA